MIDSVLAKFTVSHFDTREGAHYVQKSVVLNTQYDPSLPEDRRFTKATPMGEMKMQIDNPEALAFFKPGKSYYVEFKEAP